jgi:hypothetical protein
MRLSPSCVAAVACLVAVPALAADFDWQVVTGTSARGMEHEVNRWARLGYAAQAVVLDAPGPTIALAVDRESRRRQPPAEYRVLEPRDAGEVPRLGGVGFRLRAIGKARTGPAIAVFERDGGARDYQSLQAPPGADVEPLLARASADGYHVVGAVGDAGSEWLILERQERGDAGARESRVLSAPDVEALEVAVNDLASAGYACDAAWNRPAKGLSMFKPGTLMAVVSRRRGVTTPAAHVRVEKERRPSASGRFVAAVPYRNGLAFVIEQARETDYSVKEVTFPAPSAKRSWYDDTWLDRLDGQWWDPLVAAWAIRSGNDVTSWVGLSRREPMPRSTPATVSRKEADAIAVPVGAKALPRGGGEPGDAYRAHLAAVTRGDLPGAKALWTGEQRAGWDRRVKQFKAPLGMGFSEKDLFASLKDDVPTDPTVLGGWIDADKARLRVEGTYEGARSVSDVDLVREAGAWKIAAQQPWKPLGR